MTVTTLRQQKRDVLREAYLTAAYAAAIHGDKTTSLLPESRPPERLPKFNPKIIDFAVC
ncbi:MAG: hypothetical protein KGJ80_16525 [Chloroflexota bacterium]|nr:hypothetical protein [Chloroflexota bacterium]